MVTCNSCGSAISEEEKFCGQCGAARPASKEMSPPPPPAYHPPEPVETKGGEQTFSEPQPPPQELPLPSPPADIKPPAEKRRTCLWLAVGCGGLLLIVICVAIAGGLWIWPIIDDYSVSVPLDTFFEEPFIEEFLSSTEQAEVIDVPTIEPDFGQDLEPEPILIPDVEFEGVSFSYNPLLAAQVRSETLAGDTSAELWAYPTHSEFWFEGYIFPDSFHFPVISVYPVSEYEAVNPTAKDIIAEQRSFLAEKPFDPLYDIPFLPVWNAAQVVRVQIKYLDFQNGSGVRFLTQFAQDTAVINNEEILYTFQGLTNDGAYYVSATFPVSHPSLPPDGTIYPNNWDYWEFTDNYMDYSMDVENQLNKEPPFTFFPDLFILDEMIETLLVAP